MVKGKILVSGCLCGKKVRYDGKDAACLDPRFVRWMREGRLVGICPEVAGGFSVPREPCEKAGDTVVDKFGHDFTAKYKAGADKALALARKYGAAVAILKQNSPSCGSLYIYDGTFSGIKKRGEGVTAELLRKNGIKVFGEDQLQEVEKEIEQN